ncbi:MAG: antitoxin [Pseudonocardiaceae bacterium]
MNFDEIKNKAQDAVGQHGDKIEQGIDKGSEFAKSKFGDHSDTIDKLADKARGFVGGEQSEGQSEDQAEGQSEGGFGGGEQESQYGQG